MLKLLHCWAVERAKALRDWYRSPKTRHARGRKLLLEWLSSEQAAQYRAFGYLEVIGCHTGKRYRIVRSTEMNVYELDRDGSVRTGWCFVPQGWLVAEDVILAQKIALETDEWGALAAANNFTPR
jgi:hypothetical protein